MKQIRIIENLKKTFHNTKTLQLTHKLLKNKRISSKKEDKTPYIPILILVFSVFYFFKNLNLYSPFKITMLFVFEILFSLQNRLLTITNNKLFTNSVTNFENIFYFGITTDRETFYELFYKYNLNLKYYGLFNFDYESYLVSVNNLYLNLITELLYGWLALLILTYLIFFGIFKIKKIMSFFLVNLLILGITLVLYVVGVDNYFYDLEFFFSIFKINESFLNRNVYIDSNYFLTSDSLRGVEKFSDLSTPWLVEIEDSGWGGDFDIQDQIDIIKEREHKLITEDIDLIYTPYLENGGKVEGTFNSRFAKVRQRVDYWFDILKRYSEVDVMVWESWKLKKLVNFDSSFLKIENSFIYNFFELANLGNTNPNNYFTKSKLNMKQTKQVKKYLYNDLLNTEINNDYVLPKKNNITNENFGNSSQIHDRKQVVFRNAVNSSSNLKNNFNVDYRRPDLVLDTNYIFERQLQNSRILEYSLKEKLYTYFELKWKSYSTVKLNNIKKNKNSNELSLDRISYKNISTGVLESLKFNKIKKQYLPTYTKEDLKLENTVKYWNSNTTEHTRVFPRAYEYVYFKQNQKFISNFNENYDIVQNTLEHLLEDNKLGLGTYTYQINENAPWAVDNLEMFEFFNNFVKNSININKSSFWLRVDKKFAYNELINFVEKQFTSYDNTIKKDILILITKRLSDTWIDFEKSQKIENYQDIFLLIFYEYILENYENSKILNTVINLYIEMLNKFGVANIKISNNWSSLTSTYLGEQKNINKSLNYFKNTKIIKNRKMLNKWKNAPNTPIYWKLASNYNILQKNIKIKRSGVNYYNNLFSYADITDHLGDEFLFKKKSHWKLTPSNIKNILLKNEKVSRDFQLKNKNNLISVLQLNFKNNTDSEKPKQQQNPKLEAIFIKKNGLLEFLDYVNYFNYGYSTIFLNKMFISQRFKAVPIGKVTKKLFFCNFKIMELPIPVYADGKLYKKNLGGPTIYNINLHLKELALLFESFFVSVSEVRLSVLFVMKLTWVLNFTNLYLGRYYYNYEIKLLFESFRMKLKKTILNMLADILLIAKTLYYIAVSLDIKGMLKKTWTQTYLWLTKQLMSSGFSWLLWNKKHLKTKYVIFYEKLSTFNQILFIFENYNVQINYVWLLYFNSLKGYYPEQKMLKSNQDFFKAFINWLLIKMKTYFLETLTYLFLVEVKKSYIFKKVVAEDYLINDKNYFTVYIYINIKLVKNTIKNLLNGVIEVLKYSKLSIIEIGNSFKKQTHIKIYTFTKDLLNSENVEAFFIKIILAWFWFIRFTDNKVTLVIVSIYKKLVIFSCKINYNLIYTISIKNSIFYFVKYSKKINSAITGFNLKFNVNFDNFLDFTKTNCKQLYRQNKWLWFRENRFSKIVYNTLQLKIIGFDKNCYKKNASYLIGNITNWVLFNFLWKVKKNLDFIYLNLNIVLKNASKVKYQNYEFVISLETSYPDFAININNSLQLKKLAPTNNVEYSKSSKNLVISFLKNYNTNLGLTTTPPSEDKESFNFWKSTKIPKSGFQNKWEIFFNEIFYKKPNERRYFLNSDLLLYYENKNNLIFDNFLIGKLRNCLNSTKLNKYKTVIQKAIHFSEGKKVRLEDTRRVVERVLYYIKHYGNFLEMRYIKEAEERYEEDCKVYWWEIRRKAIPVSFFITNKNKTLATLQYYFYNTKSKTNILDYLNSSQVVMFKKKKHKTIKFKFWLHLFVDSLENKNEKLTQFFSHYYNTKNLNAFSFKNSQKVWSVLPFQNVVEKLKNLRLKKEEFYIWYLNSVCSLEKQYMLNKKLKYKLKEFNIVQFKVKYGTNSDLKSPKDYLSILNSGNQISNNNNTNNKLKMLEFFNFQNYSSFLDLKSTTSNIHDKNQKLKSNYLVKLENVGEVEDYSLKKKWNEDEENVFKLRYGFTNLSGIGFYLKNLYFFKYLNFNDFVPKWEIKPIKDLLTEYRIDLPFNNWTYSRNKIEMFYHESEVKNNNYFDMQKYFTPIHIIQNIMYNLFYRLKYLYSTNTNILQIWSYKCVNIEILEYMFEVDYRVIKTLGKKKKKENLHVYVENYKDFKIICTDDNCFGECGFNYPIFRILCNFFIYEKKKLILTKLLTILDIRSNLQIPLERQNILNFIYFEFIWNIDYFISRNVNLFINLMAIKYNLTIIWIKKKYLLGYSVYWALEFLIFVSLDNTLSRYYYVVELINQIICLWEIFVIFVITNIDYYFLKINYNIYDHPFTLVDIRKVDIGEIHFKNVFNFFYFTFTLNIRLFVEGILNFNPYVFLEHRFVNLSFLEEKFYNYIFNELATANSFQNRDDFFKLILVIDELFDFFFEKINMGLRSYFEMRGQLLWLDVCIFFDFVFETLVPFEFEKEASPFKLVIRQSLELLRKGLTGSLFSGYQFTGINVDTRGSVLKYFSKEGSESRASMDYRIQGHNDTYFDDNELIEEDRRNVELGHFGGIDQIEETNIFDFLGWGFNKSLGTNPGSEFSIINDFLEIPENLEKYFYFDLSNYYHEIFGLDGPRLGELAPAFDISLPIKSLWLVGILYYEPKTGGLLMVDFKALYSFFVILFIDRRLNLFSKIYRILDFKNYQLTDYFDTYLKLKITYTLNDFLQILDSIYINPFDFLEFFYFYLIFLINYFSIWVPIALYLIFILFGKFNLLFERRLRKYNYSNFAVVQVISQFYNYALFRYVYLFISNSFLFLKMTTSVLIILTFVYIFSEGLHIFSVLRVFAADQEGSHLNNGLYFLLERDPFVEKYVPNDEIWDQFKYDSSIDDEWSRIHYHREHAEILGGNIREHSAVIDKVGYAKKMNIAYDIHDRPIDIRTTPSKKSKIILDQIHNRIPDEGAFTPKFVNDSVLEREFFRESEMFGNEVEGSLDWFSRSETAVKDLWINNDFISYYHDTKFLERRRYKSNKNLLENNLYAALLLNFYDPKWLWDESLILSERFNKPIIFPHNKKQLYDNISENNPNDDLIFKKIIADNRIKNLIKKNKGVSPQSPILDFWDEDPLTDMGLEIQSDVGSSIGSMLNLTTTWNPVSGDILNQQTRYSLDPVIGSGVFFNYITNDDELPINYYQSENLILENFFETMFNNTPQSMPNTHLPTRFIKPRYRMSFWANKDLDTYDNYYKRSGKHPTIEDNSINNLFPKNDFLITDDLDYFTKVFIDINNYKKNENLEKTSFFKNNLQNLSLENLRRKDLVYKKLSGNDPVTYFYDEMVSEDLEKEVYRNLDNITGLSPKAFNSFFRNNEFVTKSSTNKKSIWTRSQNIDLFTTTTEKHLNAKQNKHHDEKAPDFSGYPAKNKYMKISNYTQKNKKQKELFQKKFIFNNKLILAKSKNEIIKTENVAGVTNFNEKKSSKNWNYYLNNEFTKWVNKHKIFNTDVKNNGMGYLNLDMVLNRELKIEEQLYSFLQKKKNSISDYEKKHIKINNLIKINKYLTTGSNLFKKNNIKQKYTLISEFEKLAYDWNEGHKVKSLTMNYAFAQKIKNRYKNTINVRDELNELWQKPKTSYKLFSKLTDNFEKTIKKEKLNYKNTTDFKLFITSKNTIKNIKDKNTLNLKHKLNASSIENPVNNFSNNVYTRKVNEYINERGGFKFKKSDKKQINKMLAEEVPVFLGNKWYFDNNMRLSYNFLNKKTNDSDIWKSLSKFKKNSIDYKTKIYDRTRLAKLKHSYGENRGYWANNSEVRAKTDLRMHGMFLIDHFSNPVYSNDDEAFREYIELWNPNFGRLTNNLESIGKGNVMNLDTYWYNHLILDEDHESWEADSLDSFTEMHNPDAAFWGEDNKRFGGDMSNMRPKTNRNYKPILDTIFLSKLNKSVVESLLNTTKNTNYVKKINWYDSNLIRNINLKQKEPWGLDFKKNYFWTGPQYFNMELNTETLSPLFSTKYYTSVQKTNESDIGGRRSYGFLNDNTGSVYSQVNQLNKKVKELAKVAKGVYNVEHTLQLLKTNNNNFGNKELDKNNIKKNYRNYKQRLPADSKAWTHTKYLPGNPTILDIGLDAQVKESFADNNFEYGRNLISLKQHALMQNFAANNITQQNKAITPKQGSDYFWHIYKKQKQNKVSQFFKKINYNKKSIPDLNNVIYLDWESKLNNPKCQKPPEIFTEFLNKKIKKNDNNLTNIGEIWSSKLIYDRLGLKLNDFSWGLIGNAISGDVYSKTQNPKKNNFFEKSELSLSKDTLKHLKNIGIASNNLLNNSRYKFFKTEKASKNFREKRDNFLYDTELSSRLGFKKNRKIKNKKINFSENGSLLKVNKLILKKKPTITSFNTVFENNKKFIENKAVSSALRELYEIPFDNKLVKTEEEQASLKKNQELLVNTNSTGSVMNSIAKVGIKNSTVMNINTKKLNMENIQNNLYSRKVSSFFNQNQIEQENIQGKKLPQFIDYQNQKVFENSQLLKNLSIVIPSGAVSTKKTNKLSTKINQKYYDNFDNFMNLGELNDISKNSELLFTNTQNKQVWEALDDVNANTNSYSNYWHGLNNEEFEEPVDDENYYLSSDMDYYSSNSDNLGEIASNLIDDDNNDTDDSVEMDYSEGFDMDDDFYYNKKINFNLHNNVDFRSLGSVKSINSENFEIMVENNDTLNFNTLGIFNELESDFLYLENENLTPNYLLYKKNQNNFFKKNSINSRKIKIPLVEDKLKIKNKLGNVYNKNYLGMSNKIVNTDLFGQEELFNMPITDLTKINNKSQKTENTKSVNKNIEITRSKLRGINTLNTLKSNGHLNKNTHYFKKFQNAPKLIGNLDLGVWKNKQDFTNLGEKLIFDWGSDNTLKNKILKFNHKFTGISGGFGLEKNNPFLNKKQKIDNSFGNHRFKELAANDLDFDDSLGYDLKIEDPQIFEFGFLNKNKKLRTQKIVISELQSYVKFKDNKKFVNKNIDGFYSDLGNLDKKKADLDYLNIVGLPVVKDFENKNFFFKKNQYFIYNNNTENEDSNTDFISDLLINNIETIKNQNIKTKTNRSIGGIFKSAHQFINSKNQKITNNGYTKFSANETIKPLPISRSLSVDSKLFSKINSLRIFGAGRLNDYLYQPKLKQLVKNQANFYDMEPEEGLNSEDDQFLLKMLSLEKTANKSKSKIIPIDGKKQQLKKKTPKFYKNINHLDLVGNISQNVNYLEKDNLGKFEHKLKNIISGTKEKNNTKFAINRNNYTNIMKNKKKNRYLFNPTDRLFDKSDMIPELEQPTTITPFIALGESREKEKNNLIRKLINGEILDKNSSLSNKYVLNNFGNFKQNLNNSNLGRFVIDNDLEDDTMGEDLIWERYYENFKKKINYNQSKESWLFDLYKKTVTRDSKQSKKLWYDSNLGNLKNNDDLLENYEVSELFRLENLENLENLHNEFKSSGSLDQDYGNLEAFFNMRDSTLNLNNDFNLLTLEKRQNKLLVNLTTNKKFNNIFENDQEDSFEDNDNFVLTNFNNVITPIQKNSKIGNLRILENKNVLNYENLKNRKNEIFSNLNLYKFQKNKESADSSSPLSSNTLKSINNELIENTSIFDKINRSFDQDSLDWNLERTYWSDDLFDFDYFENFEKEITKNTEVSILKKLTNIDILRENQLKASLASYFIKNKNLNIKNLNSYEKLPIISNTTLRGNFESNDLFQKSETKYLWNIKNSNEKTPLLKINQKKNSENNAQIGFKKNLKLGINNYSLKKNTLDSTSIEKSAMQNTGLLIRKANSIENSKSSRRKYRNLKKKYWYRLDILERYLSNVKKTVINPQVQRGTNNAVSNENELKEKKPIQSSIAHSLLKNFSQFAKNNKNKINSDILGEHDSDLKEGGDFTNYFDNILNKKNLKKHKIQKYKKSEQNSEIEANWVKNKSELSEYRGSRDFYLNKNLTKSQKFYKIFENSDYISKNYNKITVNNFANRNQSLLTNKGYLTFKLANLSQNKIKNKVLTKPFGNVNLSTSTNDLNYEMFADFRSNMSKLQVNKYGNSFLPISLVATFLSKIPNLNTFDYLNESEKKVNFYQSMDNLENSSDTNFANKIQGFNQVRGKKSIMRLNDSNYFKKPTVIDEFSIYHKKLRRPGLDLKNRFSKLQIDPFRNFSNKKVLLDSGLKYGLGNIVYKNGPVNRRSYDLATRTFGPSIRTNSISKGYGRFDDSFDVNIETEDDSGSLEGLGYPIVIEQNNYNTQYDMIPAWGSDYSIYENKLVDFLWNIDIPEEENPQGFNYWHYFNNNSGQGLTYKLGQIFNSIFAERRYDHKKVYDLPANHQRFVSVWNQSRLDDYGRHIDREDPKYLEYKEKDTEYTNREIIDSVADLKLTDDEFWNWDLFYNSYKTETKTYLENFITRKLYQNKSKNIGPLGYEEGDSLQDNRLLNRGWFPEKEVWGWGPRTLSAVGSDAATLELLADYKSSFNHNLDDYTKKYKYESLKDLDWAGSRKNKVFDTIDDLVEGFGFEENIPFTPSVAEKLWHKDEYLTRYVYDDFDMKTGDTGYREDDEENDFSIYTDPDGFNSYNDRLFNTLGFGNFVMGTDSWENTKYLGNLDSSSIEGISIALADNELYDGLVSDFTNFILEKLPPNPLSEFKQQNLPLPADSLFKVEDYYESKIPEFSEYINDSINDMHENYSYRDSLGISEARERDSNFYMYETFKPKDSFSFSPKDGTSQRFEPEWVINGEGWLGNKGSNKSPISFSNLPMNYTNLVDSVYTQPKGIQSFLVLDDLDNNGGLDSPYFSLSDFQKNRIVRGRDNDVSNFPIKGSWNNISHHVPDWYNAFWKHRLNFGETVYQTLGKSWNFETNKQMGGIGNPIGYGIPFSNVIGDNADFITFNASSINQRDLWWRSVDTGSLTLQNKDELAVGILKDGDETFRDFLLSYDFKLFGKSWLNPQDVKMPLKSFSFYGDSQMNDWLGSSGNFRQSDSQSAEVQGNSMFSDFSYGIFKDSQINFDINTVFYSIQMRTLLHKIYNIGIWYLTHIFGFFKANLMVLLYFFWNNVFYKLEIIEYFQKLVLVNHNYFNKLYFLIEIYYYTVLPLIYTIKLFLNIVYNVYLLLLNIETFFILSNYFFENTLIFELFYDIYFYLYKIVYKINKTLSSLSLLYILCKYFLVFLIITTLLLFF